MSVVGVCHICVCSSFPIGIEGRMWDVIVLIRMWDVIVLIPDHCLSIYFSIEVGPRSL